VRTIAPRIVRIPKLALSLGLVVSCTTRAPPMASRTAPLDASAASEGAGTTSAIDASVKSEGVGSTVDAGAVVPWSPPSAKDIDGPHEMLLAAGRPIYFARLRGDVPKPRLVAHLHGQCGAPTYACGKWIGAGVSVGTMVCPTGNARCGDSPVGPPSWEASSWQELVTIMDQDLEQAIAKVDAKQRGSVPRAGAVLTGYSRGAYAAAAIARSHPNRWPFVVLIEANAPLAASWLRKAGVRAVALVAGERGDEIAGMKKTEAALTDDGFPARLFVMRKTGHLYSDDMEDVMHAALTFVLEHEAKSD
jgi:hypothetical protein